MEDLDEAIRLDPNLAQAYTNRGNAYAGLGQLQRAIQDYDEAIRLDPNLASAYANRARAYTFLSNDAAAQRDVDTAIELGFDATLLTEVIEALKKQR